MNVYIQLESYIWIFELLSKLITESLSEKGIEVSDQFGIIYLIRLIKMLMSKGRM